MDESAEQTLARLERYAASLKENPRGVGPSQPAVTPLPPATGPELVVFGSGGQDDFTPNRRRSATLSGASAVMGTATGQLVALVACVCSIALFAGLARPLALGISCAFAILGALATWRGVPLARWWTIGVLIGGTVGLLS